jgi:hypothetical protein
MIASLVTSILIAAIGVLIVGVGIGLFYSGHFVGFPILMIGIIVLLIVGALNFRKG